MIHVASIDATTVGNVGTVETDLMFYMLHANKLDLGTKGVRITAFGQVANSPSLKTIRLYFGSTAILTKSMSVSAGDSWRIEAYVHRTGIDRQYYIAQIATLTAALSALINTSRGTLTESDGSDIIIKFTGEATSSNDIVQDSMIVEFITP